MKNASPTSVQTARVSGSQWKVLVLAAVLVVGDFLVGPRIQFGFMHLVPVMVAAWYHGVLLGVGLAFGLAAVRFTFHWSWDFPMEFMPTLINTVLRVTVLSIVAVAGANMSRHVRELRQRVRQLERRLPVCVACGVIRADDGSWGPVSALPTADKETLCPRCEERHYGHHA